MDALEAIRHMCDRAGMSTTQVSDAMGRSRAYVGATLSRGSVPKADTLAEIAQACGYKLLLEGHGERVELDPATDK